MKLKNLLPKQSSKYLLALLFSFSLMNSNQAFSEDIKPKVQFSQSKISDNFSDPDGFIDSQYHYTYFALRAGRKDKNLHNQILERSLNEIKKGNKTQQIYFNLIISYLIKKQQKKASEEKINFVKDFPNSAVAYNLLAFDYKGKKSIDLFERAVKLNPQNPLYRLGLADSYVENKLYDKALIEYEKVKSETPNIISDLDEKIIEVKKAKSKTL